MNLFATDTVKPTERLIFTKPRRRLGVYPWVVIPLIVAVAFLLK